MSEVTLPDAVKKFASDLAAKINDFVANITELEVYTFTTSPDQTATLFKGQADFSNLSAEAKAALRAYSKVSFDGDTVVWVPTNASGEVDKSVWELHQSVVQQAVENRRAMLQSVGDAAASALSALRKASE